MNQRVFSLKVAVANLKIVSKFERGKIPFLEVIQPRASGMLEAWVKKGSSFT